MFKPEKFIVVGAGGTGSFLLPVLVRYVYSDFPESRVIICDGDKYEDKNKKRQEFAHSRVGKNKAEAQADVYCSKFPELEIFPLGEYLGEKNSGIITDKSVVFCCVDNHVCRKLLSDVCSKLDNVLLISGGNEEIDGNVQPYYRENGIELTPRIEQRHPEIATTNDGDRSEMSCEEIAHLPGGVQIIMTNNTSACIMLNMLLAFVKDTKKAVKITEIFFNTEMVKCVRIINGVPE